VNDGLISPFGLTSATFWRFHYSVALLASYRPHALASSGPLSRTAILSLALLAAPTVAHADPNEQPRAVQHAFTAPSSQSNTVTAVHSVWLKTNGPSDQQQILAMAGVAVMLAGGITGGVGAAGAVSLPYTQPATIVVAIVGAAVFAAGLAMIIPSAVARNDHRWSQRRSVPIRSGFTALAVAPSTEGTGAHAVVTFTF
jgi:hypothetical protein